MAVDPLKQGISQITQMFDHAFGRADKNGDGALDKDEFKTFNEVLKPGIAVEDGKPTVDYSERMDADSDGSVTLDEMHSTGFLSPAGMTTSDIDAILDKFLAQQKFGVDPASVADKDF